MIRITVTDQGKGLGTQDTSKFFERFYQGESEKGGTGIGLAYSKVLVEQHHGYIGAFSNPEGEGASFFLRFHSAYKSLYLHISQKHISMNYLIPTQKITIKRWLDQKNSYLTI